MTDDFLKLLFRRLGLTSLAIVVMKAGGRAVAIRERACRAERAESAGGLRGKPMVILWRKGVKFVKIQNTEEI